MYSSVQAIAVFSGLLICAIGYPWAIEASSGVFNESRRVRGLASRGASCRSFSTILSQDSLHRTPYLVSRRMGWFRALDIWGCLDPWSLVHHSFCSNCNFEQCHHCYCQETCRIAWCGLKGWWRPTTTPIMLEGVPLLEEVTMTVILMTPVIESKVH